MASLIEPRKATPLFLVALVLASFGLSLIMQAQIPPSPSAIPHRPGGGGTGSKRGSALGRVVVGRPPAYLDRGPFYGSRGTFFADVDGDGKADAIAVNDDGVVVRRSDGSKFTFHEKWTNEAFYPGVYASHDDGKLYPIPILGIFFADVTGDGKADAIEIDAIIGNSIDYGVAVYRSDGSKFTSRENWTGYCGGPDPTFTGYYASRGPLFADVTGDGKADYIAVTHKGVMVRASYGSEFPYLASTCDDNWTNGAYYGSRGTFFADVTGDGYADAIVVNDDKVVVRRSDGSKFTSNEKWTDGPFYGSRGTFFADVDGDGKADAIAVNDDRVVIRRSNGSKFTSDEKWAGL
jgi:FG-GAP-like repeat